MSERTSPQISLTLLRGQHVVGRQKVKGFKAVNVQFQGLFITRGGQRPVVHGIIDLTPQEADGAVDLHKFREVIGTERAFSKFLYHYS